MGQRHSQTYPEASAALSWLYALVQCHILKLLLLLQAAGVILEVFFKVLFIIDTHGETVERR